MKLSILLCLLATTACGDSNSFSLKKNEWVCTKTAMRSVVSKLKDDTYHYPPKYYDQVVCQQWTDKYTIIPKKKKKK